MKNPPAFPIDPTALITNDGYSGMTLRDYFEADAMLAEREKAK